MYCEVCGIDSGSTCIRCGRTLLPRNEQIDSEDPSKHPWLWNPDVAAFLSWLLFTSFFGSLIHAANWKRLGQKSRMWRSIGWSAIYVFTIIGTATYGSASLSAELTYKLVLLVNFLNVAAWYFISGRAQSKFLIQEMKNQYRRESWIIPIALVMLFVFLLNAVS